VSGPPLSSTVAARPAAGTGGGGNAKLAIQLGGTTAGTEYDQVSVTGGITLAGELSGSLIDNFAPALNDLFFMMLNDSNDTVIGTYAGLAEGSSGRFRQHGI